MSGPDISWLIASNTLDNRLIDSLSSITSVEHGCEYEIILVLNGQAACAYKESLQKLDSQKNLRVIVCELPGLTHSLNLGVLQARGNYLVRLDCADLALPLRIKHCLALLKKYDCQVIVTAMTNWREERIKSSRFVRLSDFIMGNPLSHPTLMIDRELLIAQGGYQGWATAQDFDLWLRLLQRGVKIYYSDVATVVYEEVSLGLSRDYRIAYKAQIASVVRHLIPDRFVLGFLMIGVLVVKWLVKSVMSK